MSVLIVISLDKLKMDALITEYGSEYEEKVKQLIYDMLDKKFGGADKK